MDIDPAKVVGVFEYLFGQRLGRLIAQALLALITLAGFVVLVHIIWEYGGKALYSSLSIPRIQLPEPTLDSIQATIMTMMFFLIVYSAVLLGVLLYFVRRVFRTQVPQRVLDELAELRSRAIHEILNARVQSEDDYAKWKKTNSAWTDAVLGVLRKNFPNAEVLGFQRLGILLPLAPPQVFSNEHMHEMMMFMKRLTLLEDLIKRYST